MATLLVAACSGADLSRHALEFTNATRDGPNCQLFGWKCPTRRSNGTKPQRRDPAATRKKLLTAARREFADSGLAGARVDEIAARAGVNKQLVYHYFGDKDALYLAVLEWVYEEIRSPGAQAQPRGAAAGTRDPEADRELVRPSRRPSRFHRAAERREPRRRAPCPRLAKARSDAFAARQHGLEDPQRRRADQGFPQGHQSGASLYFDRGLELFLLLEHADPVGDLRQGSGSPAAKRARRKHVVDLVLQALRP